MRATPASLLSLSLAAVGTLTLLCASGCGKLWRPFLESDPGYCASPPCADQTDMSDQSPVEWDRIPSGVNTDLFTLWAPDLESDIYVGGDFGVLLRQNDLELAGFAPESTGLLLSERVFALTGDPYGPPNGAVYAAGTGGMLLRKQGGLWTRITSPVQGKSAPITSLALSSPSLLWVGTGLGELFYGTPGMMYSNGPITLRSGEYCTGATPPDGSSTWVVTNLGGIFRTNSLLTFSYSANTGTYLSSIWSSIESAGGSDRVYAVGHGGTVMKWLPADGQFEQVADPVVENPVHDYNSVYGLANGELWIVGDNGVCRYFDGSEWRESNTGTSENLYGVFVTPATKRPWIVGANGTILRRKP